MTIKSILQLILATALLCTGIVGPTTAAHAQAGTGKTLTATLLGKRTAATDTSWQIAFQSVDAERGFAAEIDVRSATLPGMQSYANLTLKRGLMKSDYGAIYCGDNGPIGYFTGVFLDTSGEQTLSHAVELVVGPGERLETMKFDVAGASFGRATVELPGRWAVEGVPCR